MSAVRSGDPKIVVARGPGEEVPASATTAHALSRSMLRRVLLLAGPLVVLAAALFSYLAGGRYVTTDNAYVQVGKANVSTDVAGNVAEIAVRNNQRVKAGDLLFRLDDEPYRIALAGAEAQLGVAREAIESMKASYRQKLEEARQAQTDLDFFQREYQRQNDLFERKITAQAQLDAARRNADNARQRIVSLRQEAAVVLANLGGKADAPVEQYSSYRQARAAVDRAARDLRRTRVHASVDGTVTQVDALQIGKYMSATQDAMALVIDGSIWVQANPKETDLAHVRPGNPAIVKVDSYPDIRWRAVVESVSPATGGEFALLPAQNASGNWVKVVQRVPVRLALELPPGGPELRSGMSAEIEIDTGHERSLSDLWRGLFR